MVFDGAMFWSGEQVCHVLTNVFSSDAVSACDGHEQAIGSIAVMWTALVLVYWRFFVKG
jgi:hypothetical protein